MAGVTLLLWAPLTIAHAQEAGVDQEPLRLRVIESVEVDLGRRKITYNRAETPDLKPQPAPIQTERQEVAPTAEDLAAIRAWEAKLHSSLFLSVTVFDGTFSELRWWDEGHENVVWSNVNFLHFSPFADLETKDAYYSVMLWGWETTSEEMRSLNALAKSPSEMIVLPPGRLPALSAAGPRWIASGKLTEQAIRAMRDFHDYYRIHGSTLAADYHRREEEARAHEAWLRANPPQPKDTTVTFFPIKSGANTQPTAGAAK